MKIVKIIIGIVIGITLILVLGIANYGGFTKIKVYEQEVGSEKLVYVSLRGSYSNTSAAINDLEYKLKKEGVETFKGVGIYYDNPRFVKEGSLRSDVGCVLESTDTSKVFWLRAKFSIMSLPKRKYISVEFPFKGSPSIMLGVLRVYPALNKYVKDNGYSEKGPIMEIYDRLNHKIIYRKEAIKKTDKLK